MTSVPSRNIAASVHQRLLNKSREAGRPFHELFQYYAIERFLFRLYRSAHADKFVLKGALMFMVWGVSDLRSTMDIDMLGRMSNSMEDVLAVIRDICRQEVEPDGIVFDPGSIRGEVITENADYEGVRVQIRGSLNVARITLQLDIGFGDVVVPAARRMQYPSVLGMPVPQLRAYSKESTVAEKFEAMVRLGTMNSRMKDFWDIRNLSRQFDFNGKTLARAIVETFRKRRTDIPMEPVALSSAFAADERKQTQWKAFLRKNRLDRDPDNFAEAVRDVSLFLKPIVKHLADNRPFTAAWKAPGPWREKQKEVRLG